MEEYCHRGWDGLSETVDLSRGSQEAPGLQGLEQWLLTLPPALPDIGLTAARSTILSKMSPTMKSKRKPFAL